MKLELEDVIKVKNIARERSQKETERNKEYLEKVDHNMEIKVNDEEIRLDFNQREVSWLAKILDHINNHGADTSVICIDTPNQVTCKIKKKLLTIVDLERIFMAIYDDNWKAKE